MCVCVCVIFLSFFYSDVLNTVHTDTVKTVAFSPGMVRVVVYRSVYYSGVVVCRWVEVVYLWC